MEHRTLNPATGELIDTYACHGPMEVEQAVAKSLRAGDAWRRKSYSGRADLLLATASLLDHQFQELAALMALEMGKPMTQGEAEVDKCAWACRYFAEHGGSLLAPQTRESDGSEAWVRFEPLGPILALLPWTFPLWQAFRFAVPALAAGNSVILCHPPNVPGCSLAVEGLFREAGAPEGLVRSLLLSESQTLDLVRHASIRGVAVNGKEELGRQVAAAAGERLKPMVLELGSCDPFVVFPDADLERAVHQGALSRCFNSGQNPTAAQRFLVHRSIFEPFAGTFVDLMRAQLMGDPRHRTTQLGPLATEEVRARLAEQVDRCSMRGAVILSGGQMPPGGGFFFPPTVLAGLDPANPAHRERLMGPVAALLPFDSEEEVIHLADDTPCGLGASLWTENRERMERLISQLRVGSVFINGMVKADPRLPYGGTKASGFGRELGREGLLEFVNIKTVWKG